MLAFTALLIASVATAIQVTKPTNSSGWTTGGSQLIEWSSVSTDPSNFTIQVINPSSPNAPQTIAEKVMTSDKSYIWTPKSDLTAGNNWRVNLVAADGGILAQSEQFPVEQGTSSVTPTAVTNSASATGSASQTSSGSASATSVRLTQAQLIQSAAASASSSGSAATLAAPTGLLLLVMSALSVFA